MFGFLKVFAFWKEPDTPEYEVSVLDFFDVGPYRTRRHPKGWLKEEILDPIKVIANTVRHHVDTAVHLERFMIGRTAVGISHQPTITAEDIVVDDVPTKFDRMGLFSPTTLEDRITAGFTHTASSSTIGEEVITGISLLAQGPQAVTSLQPANTQIHVTLSAPGVDSRGSGSSTNKESSWDRHDILMYSVVITVLFGLGCFLGYRMGRPGNQGNSQRLRHTHHEPQRKQQKFTGYSHTYSNDHHALAHDVNDILGKTQSAMDDSQANELPCNTTRPIITPFVVCKDETIALEGQKASLESSTRLRTSSGILVPRIRRRVGGSASGRYQNVRTSGLF